MRSYLSALHKPHRLTRLHLAETPDRPLPTHHGSVTINGLNHEHTAERCVCEYVLAFQIPRENSSVPVRVLAVNPCRRE